MQKIPCLSVCNSVCVWKSSWSDEIGVATLTGSISQTTLCQQMCACTLGSSWKVNFVQLKLHNVILPTAKGTYVCVHLCVFECVCALTGQLFLPCPVLYIETTVLAWPRAAGAAGRCC